MKADNTAHGRSWIATGGLFQLRRHEEAGYVDPILTARRAGYAGLERGGIVARLTESGLRALSETEGG